MKPDTDIVEMLIRSAGRRTEPPADAYEQVFAAAHASFRDKVQGRRRAWTLWAGAAAALVVAVALVMRWAPPGVPQGELAQVVTHRGRGGAGNGRRLAAADRPALPPGRGFPRADTGSGPRWRSRSEAANRCASRRGPRCCSMRPGGCTYRRAPSMSTAASGRPRPVSRS